ncbi:tetratricopeptide repeat protein [Pseudomonas costantinii]|uniref:tetratricopeptide repeat protein n=1 Tax=Pseudomonas costantinii TaxID=168469 RepID=UPI00159F9410|nr:tetratricopeptide repeat protein [Pseudomonas costantinii]NVZ71733.1 sel1 repeat family protein [Pseudomonas costantinii]
MNKVLVLLSLAVLMSGCQNFGAKDDPYASMRCWAFRDEASMAREQVEYIRKRSETGDLMCKTLLAGMYENGHGVSQDIPKAKVLYQSLAQESEVAYSFLGRIAESGLDGPPDYVKARQFYQRAANTGNSHNAEAGLARLMEEGKGGAQDLEGALALHLRAMQSCNDEQWKSILRLRARGVTLTAEQEQRMNNVWLGTTTGQLKRRVWVVQDAVSTTFKPGPEGAWVQVKVEYVAGSLEPRLSVVGSSGKDAIDRAVLQGLSDFRFPDEQFQTAEHKPWAGIAVVRIRARR